MKLEPRGGAAHGDASANPATGTYANVPPSSTYRGPKVAGTYGGFVGVFTGVGLFVLLCLLLGACIRLRQLRRQNSGVATTGSKGNSDFHSDPREHEEAFEMPRAWRAQGAEDGGGGGMNESTASFDPADVHGGGGGGGGGGREQEPFYSNIAESRSREVFFDPTSHQGGGGGEQPRYDDPYEPRK